jgi:hypothetical protein
MAKHSRVLAQHEKASYPPREVCEMANGPLWSLPASPLMLFMGKYQAGIKAGALKMCAP